MSKKIALVAATAALAASGVAADESQGFCLEVKGIKICKEEIDQALESQKINISGCVTIGGAQICKNEDSVFDEDAEQGFCVEFKGIKVCKEEIEEALESEKINITGCVTLAGVQVCKNEETAAALEEEQGLKLKKVFKGIVKAAEVAVAVGVLDEEADLEEEQFKLKKVLSGVTKAAKIAAQVGLLEEETELEEQKFKIGKALKTIGKVALKANELGLFEEEYELEDEQLRTAFQKINKKAVITAKKQVREEEKEKKDKLPRFTKKEFEEWRKKKAAQIADKKAAIKKAREERAATKKDKKSKKQLNEEAVQAFDEEVFEEEQQSIGICAEWKGIKVCGEEIEAALESEKINITGCVKVGKVEICKNEETSVFDEEGETETQGVCVEWNGIKVCTEQIEAALEEAESQGISVSGCVKVGAANICLGQEQTSNVFEEEQGFSWNPINWFRA